MTPAVEMKDITKAFADVVANDKIDLAVNKAEILGLLGENGAGKTVLMSILYGLYRPDEGQIFINGKEVEIDSPSTAMKLGVGMVHQHFMLVPSLTVAENVVLGREPTQNRLLLDRKQMMRSVGDFCERFNLEVDLKAPAYTLSVGVQQRVEILKALYRGADILILDEPTSVLTLQEAEALFKAMRALKEQGKTVIFISHKLKEVLAICDRVTVLRRGQVIGTVKTSETDVEKLAEMMVGRQIITKFQEKQIEKKEVVLKVQDLKVINDRGLPAIKGVTFEVLSSEILGMAGVEGNGQSELVEALTGLRKPTEGKVFLKNVDVTSASPAERIKLGISHVPEDRHKRGLILDFSVMENLILGSQSTRQFTKDSVRLNLEEASEHSERLVKDFSIKTSSKDTAVRNLSGGTQQKVIVAREFSREPKLIIACQPTRGLDVGATEYVRKKLVEMRDRGCAVLLISADLDEVCALSERIAVIYEGKIVAIKRPEETSEHELGLLMTGGKHG
jgi:simple sugar transport system ATP-binding protein